MSKASGLLLILAGLGAAVYVMPSGVDTSGPDASARTDIAKSPPAGIRTTVVEEVSAAKPPAAPAIQQLAPPQPAARPPERKAAAAAPDPVAPKAPVVVTLAQRPSDPAVKPAPAVRSTASLPADRASLTRELQRELKRVGCYEGEFNGTWTTQSRRAMKAFTDRVNATLPVDDPDYILLTLVQSHQDKACGKPCPAGQGTTEDGRCVPSAILAHAAKKGPPATAAVAPRAAPAAETPAPAITGWSTTATAAAPAAVPLPPATRPPGEGRMALAGPAESEARERGRGAPPPPRVVPFSGPMPPVAIYERRPPPRRYVQGPPPRAANWTRGFFKRQETSNY